MKKLIQQRIPILLTLSLAVVAPASAIAACTPDAADKPDLGFVDSNCDGIDGDKATAIFVAPGGSDANDGSFGHPMATVTAAVVAALAAHRDVYVAAGTYSGKVSILGGTGGIGIYGGYDPATWARSAANLTTLQAAHQVVTVAVPGIVLQMLTIKGIYEGSTSYGVRAWNQGGFALSRVTVEPAAGGNGSDGANAYQSPPEAAPNGKQGGGNPNCDPNALKGTFNPGAKGGEAPGLLSGGTGGDWFKPYPYSGTNGQGDPGVGGGIGGEMYWPGGLGSPGLTGSPGLPGLDSLNRAALIYAPMPGTDAGGGTRGAGGGGGGMGADTCIPGSGGGAGGRPGSGGKGGSGGGGSIGVFVGEGAHALILDGSAIHAGGGGKGGSGGLGQPGGAGGEGGEPGIDIYDNGEWPGTSGGHGGKGGNGGQGGGGGASVGVLAVDARATVAPDTAITVGKGGYGGQGGHIGWQGVSRPTSELTTLNGSLPAVGDFDGDGLNDEVDACPILAGAGNGCPSPAAGPTAGSGHASQSGAAAISVLPDMSCLPKAAFTVKLDPRKSHVKSAKLTLDGHRLKLVKGRRRWSARVDLSHSNRSSHTLTIRGKLSDGRSFKQTRHYRTCAR